jgi:hypothetical protein
MDYDKDKMDPAMIEQVIIYAHTMMLVKAVLKCSVVMLVLLM